jgi:hypothetical protein
MVGDDWKVSRDTWCGLQAKAGPGRANGDDSAIQRDRPNPDGRLFGQATTRTRHRGYANPPSRRGLTEGVPFCAPHASKQIAGGGRLACRHD